MLSWLGLLYRRPFAPVTHSSLWVTAKASPDATRLYCTAGRAGGYRPQLAHNRLGAIALLSSECSPGPFPSTESAHKQTLCVRRARRNSHEIGRTQSRRSLDWPFSAAITCGTQFDTSSAEAGIFNNKPSNPEVP